HVPGAHVPLPVLFGVQVCWQFRSPDPKSERQHVWCMSCWTAGLVSFTSPPPPPTEARCFCFMRSVGRLLLLRDTLLLPWQPPWEACGRASIVLSAVPPLQ
ncbi:unnamed protein product, partial [Pylaiella littoralis]